MKTAGPAAKLLAQADRTTIAADGQDLSFITITVADKDGVLVPRAKNRIRFSLEGPGEIVATDNGDPTSFESFPIPANATPSTACAWRSCAAGRGKRGPSPSKPSPKDFRRQR